MSEKQISNELMKLVQKAQKDEEEGAILYSFMAKREKNEENKKLLEQMSSNACSCLERYFKERYKNKQIRNIMV